jgi:hypothetical protein
MSSGQTETTDCIIYLNDLPPEHSLRNAPLIKIGAFYLACGSKVWREVFPAFGIAKCTYNELGDVWTKWDKWKATRDITYE